MRRVSRVRGAIRSREQTLGGSGMTSSIFDRYYNINVYSRRVDTLDKCKLDEYNWRVGGRAYDICVLADKIGMRLTRDSDDYRAHNDIQIELTMSCSQREALSWMQIWMLEALASANNVVDVNLRAKFLAAYDMYQHLRMDNGEHTPSASAGDYSPSCPWNAPGMRMSDFI